MFLIIFLTFLFPFLNGEATIGVQPGNPSCPADPSEPCHGQDCSSFGDNIGKRLQCLGELYENRRMTSRRLEEELFAVIKLLPSDQQYWSIGLVTGSSNRLAIGVQSHFSFDSVAAIRMNPYAAMIELIYYVQQSDVIAPTILFTDTDISPTPFPDTPLAATVVTGSGKTKVVYGLAERSREIIGNRIGCEAFIAWNHIDLITNYVGVVIVMPRNYYCKDAETKFDVAIGEYTAVQDEKNKFGEQYLEPKWEVTSGYTFGTIPPNVPVF